MTMHPYPKRFVALMLMTVLLGMVMAGCSPKSDEVTLKIGAQNYAEVIIMAYMAEALIEDQTDYNVEVVSRLASVIVLDQAMQTGDVDIASLFFTGGASGILHPKLVDKVGDINDPKWRDAKTVFEFVQKNSAEELSRQWLEPLGYENTYAVTVRKSMAEEYNLKAISDLKGLSADLIIGMDDAYMDREIDGYQPMLAKYELEPFKQAVTMQINLLYQAIRDEQVDVGVAYSTDARIHAYDLVWLDDDRSLYPPFEAAYAVNLSTLEKAPEVAEVLGQLSGKIDVETIQRLNYEVDIKQRDHQEVAIEYLKEIGLLK
jgi:osmoprotectant transport system substrate-binding protein